MHAMAQLPLWSAAHPTSGVMAVQELDHLEQNTPEPKYFPGILDGLKRLTLNTEDMHRCYCIHGASLWSKVRHQSCHTS